MRLKADILVIFGCRRVKLWKKFVDLRLAYRKSSRFLLRNGIDRSESPGGGRLVAIASISRMNAATLSGRPPIEILLVEDNAGDVRLAVEAFRDAEVPNHVSVARDGEEALAFLRRQGAYESAPRPKFILLDLNMPKKDGREVLREVKTDRELKVIPIMVLTTSLAPMDITQSYNLHANGYIQKPTDYDEFLQLIRQLDSLWFSIVQLPPAPEDAAT
jgi:chemotaxis family two-component system response regulator Rcp1